MNCCLRPYFAIGASAISLLLIDGLDEHLFLDLTARTRSVDKGIYKKEEIHQMKNSILILTALADYRSTRKVDNIVKFCLPFKLEQNMEK